MLLRNNEYSTLPIEMMQQLLRTNQSVFFPRTELPVFETRAYSIISISDSHNLGFVLYVTTCS